MVDRNTNASWLLTCPCGDCNFKGHLKQATAEEIKSVLAQLPEKGNVTKRKVLTAELRKRGVIL